MKLGSRIHRLIPWVVAASLLGYLLWRIPIGEAWQAIFGARLEIFLPLVAAATVAWFLLDSAALAYLFDRFNTPFSFAEGRAIRGLSYLLTPVHWNLGRAAVVARLHRAYRVPLLEASSSLLLYQTLDAILLAALAWIGLSEQPPSPEIRALQSCVAGLGIGLTLYLLAARWPIPRSRLLTRLRALPVHHAHRRMELRDVAAILSLRLAYYAVFVALYLFGAAAFDIDLPTSLVIAAVPVIQAIGAIPVSPAGLGTQQAAMLYFFSDHGSPAAIMAFGLSFPLLTIALRCVIGWPYLRNLTRVDALHSEKAAVAIE